MFNLGSVVEDNGPYTGWCGYCQRSDTNVCHGMWGHRLTVEDYNSLLDRGWRRSGCWLYQPDMRKTCCPQYTIRLNAGMFQPNKSQSKVLRKMKAWLASYHTGMHAGMECTRAAEPGNCGPSAAGPSGSPPACGATRKEDSVAGELQQACRDVLMAAPSAGQALHGVAFSVRRVSAKQRKSVPQDVCFTSSVSFPAAAAARKAGNAQTSPDHIAGCLASALTEAAMQPSGALARLGVAQVEANCGHLNFHMGREESKAAGEPEVLKRPKVAGPSPSPFRTAPEGEGAPSAMSGEAPPAPLPQGTGKSMESQAQVELSLPMRLLGCEPGHGGAELKVEFVPSEFDEEEFRLYRKYQVTQHHDKPEEVTESIYTRFLVDTPLQHGFGGHRSGAPPCGYGSFHVRYTVEGRLIAVSVVDVLPHCVSSKYFFWDTDLAFLSLGKLSTLFEVFWIQQMSHEAPQLQYYYLGYYIHNCSKMRYKAQFRPSDLLCPIRYVWVPYERVKDVLERAQRDGDGGLCVLSDVLLPPGDERRLTDREGRIKDNDGRGAEIAASAPPPVEVSKNACRAVSKADVLSVPVLKQGQLMQLRQEVSDGADASLLDRVKQWADAVGLPFRRTVYVLPALWSATAAGV